MIHSIMEITNKAKTDNLNKYLIFEQMIKSNLLVLLSKFSNERQISSVFLLFLIYYCYAIMHARCLI